MAKDVLGWDQTQAGSLNGICRHTALAALAQLRGAAIRNALTGHIQLPVPGHDTTDTGLIARARLAFALHWSVQRRRHQAIARWQHYSARLLTITGTG